MAVRRKKRGNRKRRCYAKSSMKASKLGASDARAEMSQEQQEAALGRCCCRRSSLSALDARSHAYNRQQAKIPQSSVLCIVLDNIT